MSVYVSKVKISKVQGVHRRAELPAGVVVDFGVHGPIKQHYAIDSEDQPLPVDFVVAAAGG